MLRQALCCPFGVGDVRDGTKSVGKHLIPVRSFATSVKPSEMASWAQRGDPQPLLLVRRSNQREVTMARTHSSHRAPAPMSAALVVPFAGIPSPESSASPTTPTPTGYGIAVFRQWVPHVTPYAARQHWPRNRPTGMNTGGPSHQRHINLKRSPQLAPAPSARLYGKLELTHS